MRGEWFYEEIRRKRLILLGGFWGSIVFENRKCKFVIGEGIVIFIRLIIFFVNGKFKLVIYFYFWNF